MSSHGSERFRPVDELVVTSLGQALLDLRAEFVAFGEQPQGLANHLIRRGVPTALDLLLLDQLFELGGQGYRSWRPRCQA